MSTQFIRLPAAALHATDRQLGTVALKATAAWLMTIPGYRAPHGGIKAQLRRYFRKGSAFAATTVSIPTTSFPFLPLRPMGCGT